MEKQDKNIRKTGILMPVSSLPSDCGIGTLGKGAYQFVDWLESAGMKIWQVLPLLPTSYGDSPYQSYASDALNFYFIDFKKLTQEGLLEKSDYAQVEWSYDIRRVDYGKQFQLKKEILRLAFSRFDQNLPEWTAFLSAGKYADFGLFMSLKENFGYAAWSDWPEPYKNAEEAALANYAEAHRDDIAFWQFTQYMFLKQWNELRAYAKARNVEIMGDMPIYVAYDSVETWKYRKELFMLDGEGNVSLRAGVPPDAFSDDGQLWGNPVYDWKKMRENGYAWWKERFRYAFSLFDIVRIDHFRAFDRFYVIPSGAETAKEGEWLDGPKTELFAGNDSLAIVAEDLGIIDDGVRALLKATGFPGMKIFQFAFDGDPNNDYLIENVRDRNCVFYTGTHDNDTLRAFIEKLESADRKYFETVLEEACLQNDVAYITETIEDECKTVIELLMSSVADTVIVPMHDVLCFGEEARLNAPSTVSSSNWTFRFTENDFSCRKARWLKECTEKYNR